MVVHNFCTIGKTNGHITNEYRGYEYNTALISFGEEKSLSINYRLFRCSMKPIVINSEDKTTKTTVNNRIVHCSIFGSGEKIENIFHTADNKQILYAYHFPAYDDYDKYRNCYRLFALFGNETNYYNILLEQLVGSQFFVLNHLLRYTSLYALKTRMYINGISYDWEVWPEPAKFFVEIFDKDYRILFEKRLQEITQIMVAKNIFPIDDF